MSLPKNGGDVGSKPSPLTAASLQPCEGSRETPEGVIISIPWDWCKSPTTPVPYKIWARQIDAAELATTVRNTDERSHVSGSIVRQCFGDEAGTGGGIHSGTHNAECTPKTWSDTVRAESRNMVRHNDEWWMNHRNTWGKLNYIKDPDNYETNPSEKIAARLEVAQAFATDGPVPLPLPGPQQYQQLQNATGALVKGAQGLAPEKDETFGEYMQRPLYNLGIKKRKQQEQAPAAPLTQGIVRSTADEQKKCPCTVGPYSTMQNVCPEECPGSQAHHIVPDYILGPGKRKERVQGSRLYDNQGVKLPSYNDGPAICLLGNAKTPGTPHNVAHSGDSQLQGQAAANGGVVRLGDAVDISVSAALEARPECAGEILTKTYDAFGSYDPDTNVRGQNNPIKPDDPASGRINVKPPGS